ncbi:hypothetical protein D3C86_2000090 [compost metagenome]
MKRPAVHQCAPYTPASTNAAMPTVGNSRRLNRGGLAAGTGAAKSGSAVGMLVMEDYLLERGLIMMSVI